MKLTRLLPKRLQKIIRERMTIHVYTYAFRPSAVVKEQALRFSTPDREFTVKADYRTPLYDMIREVVEYDAYQLQKLQWDSAGEHYILDIGANVGVSALMFSQIPNARVTCFEPDPGNCALFRQNLELNGITNARVIQAAVTSVDGITDFRIDEESTGGHVASGTAATKGSNIKVRAINLQRTVDECGGAAIDLLKCDCEGGEYDIIEQITPELAGRIRNLTIEVHDLSQKRNLQSICAHLSALGYQLSCKPDLWGRGALHLLLARRGNV